jgi:hypothetical protein
MLIFLLKDSIRLHTCDIEEVSDFVVLSFLCILTDTKAFTMRFFVIVVSVVCVFIHFSCGENEGGGRLVTTKSNSLPALSTPANPSNSAASTVPAGNPSAPLIAAGRVNPAHGQPGHRCDIAVGAPLPTSNTPVLNTNALSTPVINTPVPTTVTQPQPVATVANGLNPPHGQPGHRCDIPVGTSLSQPVAKNPATTVTPQASKPLIEAPDTLFAKGLNPAHGKPGHRCDIAVGQPLASADKKDPVKTN